MWEKFGFYLIVLQTIVGGIVCTFMRNTDAEILYKINWPGKIDTELSVSFLSIYIYWFLWIFNVI